MSLQHLRTEYGLAVLEEQDAGDDPLALFQRWFDEAVQSGARDPNAMALATTGVDGFPQVRIVLCKEFGAAGFVFFTNYTSGKGEELARDPRAGLLFFWPQLERQVRIAGTVDRVPAEESDRYFDARPRAARIGAWASPQSAPLQDRAVLEARYAKAEARFAGQESFARPPHWGGYRLQAQRMEFWQGRASRLHDRLVYQRPADGSGGWTRVRLAP